MRQIYRIDYEVNTVIATDLFKWWKSSAFENRQDRFIKRLDSSKFGVPFHSSSLWKILTSKVHINLLQNFCVQRDCVSCSGKTLK